MNLRKFFSKKRKRGIGPFLSEMFDRFFALETTRMAAALAFYIALSFAPLILLFISVSALFTPGLENVFAEQIESLAGPAAHTMFREVVSHAQDNPKASSISGMIGLAWLMFSASFVFGELRADLNKIFDCREPQKDASFRRLAVHFIKDQLSHVGLVLSFIFLLLVSLIASSVVNALNPSQERTIAGIVNLFTSFGVYVVAFTLMLRYVPNVRQPWRRSWRGGLLIAVLFTIGKELIGFYIGRSAIGSTYGATGTAIVFLAWIYYSATIVFFGAQASELLSEADPS